MSESSRSRVTITLGHTGQVVKRAGSALDSSFADLHCAAGNKRSVHERLGNAADSSFHVNNKRLRDDGRSASSVSDIHLGKDDLRYKIMQKNMLKQRQDNQQNGLDLRNILSRPAQSSTNSVSSRERMNELKDARLHGFGPMEGRQHFRETRDRPDSRHILHMTRSSSQNVPEFRAEHSFNLGKQNILEATEGGRRTFEAKDIRHHMPEPSNPRMMSSIHGIRASGSMVRMESGFNPYSPWTLDRLRQRSPDESLATAGGITINAPKRGDTFQREYAVRPCNDARTSTYVSKDSFNISRPPSSSHLAKMAPPAGQIKTTTPVASTHPLSQDLVQKSSYVVDDQLTVDSFLRSLGLEKYTILFKAEEVDMYSLKRMTETDLKDLGIPMGPRKKILLALQPRLKQPA